MDEYRFVIALTYEKLSDRRARHLRAMVMWEQSAAQPAGRMPARRARGARDPLPHAAGDRAAVPARIRSASASSRSGGPRGLYSIAPVAGGETIRVRQPQAAT